MPITNDTLREYADRLEAAGFTIYEPVSPPAHYFRYSRVVNGRECFGYVQRNWNDESRFSHTMPIKPSIEYGSSMWVERIPPALTVEAAAMVARPFNHNPIVGTHYNHDDPQYAKLYVRRDSRPKIESGGTS